MNPKAMLRWLIQKTSSLRYLGEGITIAEKLARDERSRLDVEGMNSKVLDELKQGGNPLKIEFGAGSPRGLLGWTYADVIPGCDLQIDASLSLPIADASVDEIYSSHLLEHLDYHALRSFLGECLRILKPGGRFGAAVPNAKLYIQAYATHTDLDLTQFCGYTPAFHHHARIDYVNYIAYMDGHHRFMFDQDNLVAILSDSGFRDVSLRAFDPNLDVDARRFESIYVCGRA